MAPKSPECVFKLFDGDPSLAVYLGGLMAAEGTITFIVNDPPYPRAYPYMEFCLGMEHRADLLRHRLNSLGHKSDQSDDSFSLIMTYVKIVPEMVRRIAPFEPSRIKAAQFMTRFEMAETMDEKINIAQDYQGTDRRGTVSVDDYIPLTKIRPWIGGILDSRKKDPERNLKIQSQMKPLLEAIISSFPGEINPVIREGRHDSWELKLTEDSTSQIYDFGGKHRLLTWQDSYSKPSLAC